MCMAEVTNGLLEGAKKKEDFKHHSSFDHNPEVPERDRYPPQRKRRAFWNPWSNNNSHNVITLILYNIGVGSTVGPKTGI